MTSPSVSSVNDVHNVIGGTVVPPHSGEYLEVYNPATDELIGKVGLSGEQDVEDAVAAAKAAFPGWSSDLTIKARAAIMLKFHALVNQHATELVELIVRENGKNITEALADGTLSCYLNPSRWTITMEDDIAFDFLMLDTSIVTH